MLTLLFIATNALFFFLAISNTILYKNKERICLDYLKIPYFSALTVHFVLMQYQKPLHPNISSFGSRFWWAQDKNDLLRSRDIDFIWYVYPLRDEGRKFLPFFWTFSGQSEICPVHTYCQLITICIFFLWQWNQIGRCYLQFNANKCSFCLIHHTLMRLLFPRQRFMWLLIVDTEMRLYQILDWRPFNKLLSKINAKPINHTENCKKKHTDWVKTKSVDFQEAQSVCR